MLSNPLILVLIHFMILVLQFSHMSFVVTTFPQASLENLWNVNHDSLNVSNDSLLHHANSHDLSHSSQDI